MQAFSATIAWSRDGSAFTDQRYSRAHTWSFDGGLQVPASSSPLSVPLPMSNPANVDPEEALVAATSSCHMLWFLHIAASRGFVVDTYHDEPVGEMHKNDNGKLAMTRITLRPRIVFDGRQPTSAELGALHHTAHDECYIANSIKADVVVEQGS
jgi:organic hydroperoxide reductase OsmC/OhrA